MYVDTAISVRKVRSRAGGYIHRRDLAASPWICILFDGCFLGGKLPT